MRSRSPLLIKITQSFPVDSPDRNGVVYSKDSVRKALSNTHDRLPIIFRGQAGREVLLGHTISDPYNVREDDWFIEFTVDGLIYNGGTEEIIGDSTESKIKITSIGFSD